MKFYKHITGIKKRLFSTNFSWGRLFSAAVLSAYAYVFFEWLFIVTKPSFISTAPMLVKIRVGLFTASLLAAACIVPLLALMALSWLAGRLLPKTTWARRLLLNLGAAVPAGLLACLALLLIDNFTYTVFKFGIVTSEGAARGAYLLLLLVLFAVIYYQLKKSLRERPVSAPAAAARPMPQTKRPARRWAEGALVGLVIASFLLNYERPEVSATASEGKRTGGTLPHIVMVTADGLNAANTSIYEGYERDTTPVLRELAKHSLLVENAFTNSGKTMGSILSIYNSKYPSETRALFAPDILHGRDAYQHLPNILKHLGYYNIQYGHVIHIDAFGQNILAGFDDSNGKELQLSGYQTLLNEYLETDYSYFVYEIANRVIDRLRHITYNKHMPNQKDLTSGSSSMMKDKRKMDYIIAALKKSDKPVFAHMHWLGTHGSKFDPTHRVYSKDQDVESQDYWDRNFYDDSILDFDAGIGALIERLKEMGIYDNTILIISTDHSQRYLTSQRLPLLIHFPGDQYQRQVMTNVQLMDIAPTLLDYLKVPKPEWMRGTSFLTTDPPVRPIIGVGIISSGRFDDESQIPEKQYNKPPFYNFGFASVVYCDTYYELDLYSYQWRKNTIPGYVGSCGLPPASDQTAFTWMRDRLTQDGFDTTSLSNFPPVANRDK